MSTYRVRKSVLCFAVAAVALVPSVAASGRALGSSDASDADLAAKMSLTVHDLPSAIKWSAPVKRVPGAGDGRLIVSCMRATGGIARSISPDLFGIVDKSGGIDTADVEAPLYERSGVGVPLVTSDVVFVTSAAQARNDLAAMNTTADIACLPNIFGPGHAKVFSVTVTRRSRPAYGTGNGGVHVRLTTTGARLPSTNYSDTYYYVDGRAEIAIIFGSSAAHPLSASLVDAVVAKIMIRAKSVLG
jgi:hypothetical protein